MKIKNGFNILKGLNTYQEGYFMSLFFNLFLGFRKSSHVPNRLPSEEIRTPYQ